VGADSTEKKSQDRCDCQREDRDGNDGDCGPKKEGMPLPLPELTGEGEGMFAGGVEELVRRERHGCGVEDSAGDADERDDQKEFERIHNVIAQLRGGNVEAEDNGQREAEDGGAAKDGVDADEEAGSDAPGELFRRRSHAEQCEDGKDDAAVEPVVMDGNGRLVGVDAIWFVGLHFLQDRLRV
jgi:hypothetical protein